MNAIWKYGLGQRVTHSMPRGARILDAQTQHDFPQMWVLVVELKYIMLLDDKLDRRVPILFFEPVTHIGVYEMTRNSEELDRMRLVSAGFARIQPAVKLTLTSIGRLVQVYGESTSLKAKRLPHAPLKDDGRVIAMYNYQHGF